MNQRKKRAKVSERLRSAYHKGHKDAQAALARALVDVGITAETHDRLFALLIERSLPVGARGIALSSPTKNHIYTIRIDDIPTGFLSTTKTDAVDMRKEFLAWVDSVNAEITANPEIAREAIDLIQRDKAGRVIEHIRLIGARGPWLGAADGTGSGEVPQ